MEKWIKRLVGLTAVIGAVAGLVYYFKNRCSCDGEDELVDDFEDEDFDLDNDLKPVSEREYVPLTPSKSEPDAESADSNSADSNSTDSNSEEESTGEDESGAAEENTTESKDSDKK